MIGKLALGGLTALSLAGCATQEPRPVTVTPVAASAAVPIAAPVAPAAVVGADTGADMPGATGAIIGPVTGEPGMCYARDQSDRTIKIQCPPGF